MTAYSRFRLGLSGTAFRAVLFWTVAFLPGPVSATDPRFGRVLDRVECGADATQSYALYIPSNYSADRPWPVIFCFDPGARGLMPVERLKVAAEKYGYLVAASLNSRNGPWAQNLAAANAMIRDVTTHFSVDRGRIYTAGMSGGARVASSLALGGVAHGVIACGAGFPIPLEQLPARLPFAFFGVTGTEDFNHAELQRVDAELSRRRTPHRIVSFDGGHVWAPATVLTEAVEWLEVQAMRAGARTKDPALIANLLQQRLASVPPAPAFERCRSLQSFVEDFDTLADVTALAHEAQALAASREVKKAFAAERDLLAREDDLLAELGRMSVSGAEPNRQRALELKRKADAPLDSPERRVIRRAIAGYASMARETVRSLFAQADYETAEVFLEFGVALQPDHRGMWFDLARTRGHRGDRKDALTALEKAVEAGYSDAVQAENEPAFARLRRDPRFLAALEKMRTEAANPSLRLPALRVSAALAGAELRLVYLPPNGPGTPPLSHLRVETVRSDSLAARGGLQPGMEITSIQTLALRGISEREFNDAMARRVRKEIVLTARDQRDGQEREIRLTLRAPERIEGAPLIQGPAD